MKTERYSSHAGSAPHHQGQIYNEATGKTVAITYDDERGEVAMLLAAAPDMLATLEWVKQWLVDLEKDSRTVTRHIVAEINKVIGR